MIYDISQELRDFNYITSVYKSIAAYHLKGHQIGRKIGDMLEILTMGAIYQNTNLLSRLGIEKKLEGYTTAGHKVEFGFYKDPARQQGLFGAIECKCVGVEETKAGKEPRHLRKIHVGESFTLDLKSEWMPSSILYTIKVISGTTDQVVVEVTDSKTAVSHIVPMSAGENIKLIVDESLTPLCTTPHGNMLQEIPGLIRTCKTIKFDRTSDGLFQFSLYNCLAGPQTIEKAKQASLVAMDLRKKIDGHWGLEEVSEKEKQMNFVLVLCEYSHWEQKSRNVIQSCIDHTVIVPDAVLIKAFEVFEATFGLQDMLDRIGKKQYISNPAVQDAIQSVFEYFEDHIFYDLTLHSYVKFDCTDDRLLVSPI